MKTVFRVVMSIFTQIYRISNGKIMGRMAGLNILLLTTTGRKSGKPRVTPLGYFEHGDAYVIIASNAGMDKHPEWFLNLKANPHVNVRIREKELHATAKLAVAEQRKRLWDRLVGLSPQYERYTRGTRREIPVILLQPEA